MSGRDGRIDEAVGRSADPMMAAMPMLLRNVAHARTGDKGNLCNISVVAWSPELFPLLVEQLTEAVVAAHFAHRRPSAVRRYLLPQMGAMNWVLEDVLDGGVTDSLNLDAHGKSLSFHLLALPVRVPVSLRGLCRFGG